MRIVMGIIVVAMGVVVVLQDTCVGFLQIAAGAFLTYRGIRAEIKADRERGEASQ